MYVSKSNFTRTLLVCECLPRSWVGGGALAAVTEDVEAGARLQEAAGALAFVAASSLLRVAPDRSRDCVQRVLPSAAPVVAVEAEEVRVVEKLVVRVERLGDAAEAAPVEAVHAPRVHDRVGDGDPWVLVLRAVRPARLAKVEAAEARRGVEHVDEAEEGGVESLALRLARVVVPDVLHVEEDARAVVRLRQQRFAPTDKSDERRAKERSTRRRPRVGVEHALDRSEASPDPRQRNRVLALVIRYSLADVSRRVVQRGLEAAQNPRPVKEAEREHGGLLDPQGLQVAHVLPRRLLLGRGPRVNNHALAILAVLVVQRHRRRMRLLTTRVAARRRGIESITSAAAAAAAKLERGG
mmetsp:Transcript_6399/g.21392  ORF Transcript_6399/g.21392 Transcript_6399/m.21392 type:complete len:354 (+) Transcript_6399:931-1992(+)